MMFHPIAPLALTLLLAGQPGGVAPLKVTIVFTDADLGEYANDTIAVCKQWYPKINEILFGAGHWPHYDEVKIILEPPENSKYDGWMSDNVIHFSAGWMKKKPHHLDYRAVVIH